MMLIWQLLIVASVAAALWLALKGLSVLHEHVAVLDIEEWHDAGGKLRLAQVRMFPESYEIRKVDSEGNDVPAASLLSYAARRIRGRLC